MRPRPQVDKSVGVESRKGSLPSVAAPIAGEQPGGCSDSMSAPSAGSEGTVADPLNDATASIGGAGWSGAPRWTPPLSRRVCALNGPCACDVRRDVRNRVRTQL
jgi:hypothetical protein